MKNNIIIEFCKRSMDEAETCPRCRSTKYRNPSMKLMINSCGHPLCETCVEQVFFRGSAPCPKCSKALKKADYRYQIFEDNYVEKDIAIRKRLMKDFAETEEDFASLKEFNDYLEKIETFVFNLTNNNEEERTIEDMEKLKQELKLKKAKNKLKTEYQIKENQLFSYKTSTMYLYGPSMPTIDDLNENYVRHMKVASSYKSGGFVPIIPVRRQLQEAFSGLFISAKRDLK